jgi:hypothetical protein
VSGGRCRQDQAYRLGALIFLAAITSAQDNVKPNFSGTWKVISSPANLKTVMQFEQTGTTFEMRPVVDGGPVAKWIAYPIDVAGPEQRRVSMILYRFRSLPEFPYPYPSAYPVFHVRSTSGLRIRLYWHL